MPCQQGGLSAFAAAPAGNVSIYVYGAGDIVSDHLKGAQHGWETVEIQEWLWAIRQWQQQPAALPAASTNTTRPDRPLTVDIGANLGWFSLNAAAAGARVAAFEGERAHWTFCGLHRTVLHDTLVCCQSYSHASH